MSPLSYGEMIPKLTPDDTDGKPVVLTVKSVREQNMAREGQREEIKLIIEFAQQFDRTDPKDAASTRREYIVNSTSYKTLCDKLGTDYKRWVGQDIVMAPTTTNMDGKSYEKIHVAAPERWDKVINATTRAKSSKR
jgi:hypothetical protein